MEVVAAAGDTAVVETIEVAGGERVPDATVFNTSLLTAKQW